MDKIIELYDSGLSQRAVAAAVGASQTQVGRVLRAAGKSRQTRLNSDIEREILSRYSAGENSEVLAKKFAISPSTACRVIKRLGGRIRPPEENKRQYDIHEDFFNVIDTEEKAYILGFLYADGNVHSKNNTVKIEIHKQDIDILYKILDCIFIGKKPKISRDTETYRYITITSKNMKKDLIKQGCMPCKTFKIRMPDLNNDLERHFLRGVYDGDGCISIDKNGRIKVVLTDNSLFTTDIKKIFDSHHIANSHSEPKTNVGSLSVSARLALIDLLKILYDGSTICLDRKYRKYIESMRLIESKDAAN